MKRLWNDFIFTIQSCCLTWLFGVLALLLLSAGTAFLSVSPELAPGSLSAGILAAAIWLAAVTS